MYQFELLTSHRHSDGGEPADAYLRLQAPANGGSYDCVLGSTCVCRSVDVLHCCQPYICKKIKRILFRYDLYLTIYLPLLLSQHQFPLPSKRPANNRIERQPSHQRCNRLYKQVSV